MDLIDALSALVDSGVPEAANNGPDFLSAMDTGSGWMPGFTADAVSQFAGQNGGTLMSGLMDWAKANPQIAGSLFGAAGPLAGLLGNIASGGVQGNTSGTNFSNQFGSSSGSQSGSSSGLQTGTSSGSSTQNLSGTRQEDSSRTDSGWQNQTTTPTIDPAAQGAMDRLTAMLSRNDSGAQGAYDLGLSLMSQLAGRTMGESGQGYSGPSSSAIAPNTTPRPAAVTGFPTELPTAYDPKIGNLVKQAFGSFIGDLGSQAITNARGRGFAGGADLLNTAAAPMMGQSLAQVPAMEAKAYLDHVLQAYGLQSENASRKAGAEAGALNAATNALGPDVARYGADIQKYGQDVQKYGIDRNADNNQLGQMTNLLQSLMSPYRDMMAGNQNLLTGAPRGSVQQQLSGGQSNQSLSGSNTSNQTNQNQSSNTSLTQNQNQSQNQAQTQNQTQGGQTAQSSIPMGNVLGKGLGDIIGGAGVGATAGGAPDWTGQAAKNNPSLLALLKRLGGA